MNNSENVNMENNRVQNQSVDNSLNNVTPTPIPIQPQNVTPSQMPSQNQSVTPTPVSTISNTPFVDLTQSTTVEEPTSQNASNSEPSPFFTPESVQPVTPQEVVLPEIQPPVEQKTEPTPVQSQPTSNNIVSEVQNNTTIVAPTEPTNTNKTEESMVQVINTRKTKTSNVILIIFVILLIAFVLNIDTVIKMYDEYKSSKQVVVNSGKKDDDKTSQYIIINENNNSITLNKIKFYNFKQVNNTITFNYESSTNNDNPSNLEMYIELYNSDKVLLYKELFNPTEKLENGTVRVYTMDVSSDIYSKVFYGNVKVYTEEEKSKTSQLVCTFDDDNYSYKNTYYFRNNGLEKYDVYKKAMKSDDKNIEEEYNNILESITNAKYENNELTYNVDVSIDNGAYNELYEKDTTLFILKEKETAKEWKCE